MSKKFNTSVILPSYNNIKQLKSNFSSIQTAAKHANAKIVVVDDNSSDESFEYLASLKSRDLKILKNDKNLGFAKTVNRGVSEVKSDFVVLVNSDVKLKKNTISNSFKYFDDSNIFAITFDTGEGFATPDWKNGLFNHTSNSNSKEINYSLWASGGHAIYRKKYWAELGGFDSIFSPFYWEDTDLGYRAWKRGYKILHCTDCKAEHLHDQSVISKLNSKKRINEIALRNQIIFTWKNIHSKRLIASHIINLPRLFLKYPKPFIRATKLIPKIIHKRRHEIKSATLSDNEIIGLWSKSV